MLKYNKYIMTLLMVLIMPALVSGCVAKPSEDSNLTEDKTTASSTEATTEAATGETSAATTSGGTASHAARAASETTARAASGTTAEATAGARRPATGRRVSCTWSSCSRWLR